jgi:deazaflavin-dependent oxidoreductase (nitroreductase family)
MKMFFVRIMSALHRFLYRLTGGAIGGRLMGAQVLLLTTIGRKSGRRRTTPLIYGTDGERLILIASKAGAPEHPLWYTNLKAHPEIEAEVRRDRRTLRARDATAEERPRLWRLMADQYKGYDEYQKKTSREIPVVVLEPR